MQATATSLPSRNLWRSTGAVLAGFLTVAVLSVATDVLLHLLKVYPPWDQGMHDPGLNLLALSYRIVYTILGSYVTARLAPRNRMRHALILGTIGFVVGSAAAAATIPMKLGPDWYPIAIALTALPCAWLGGVLHRKRHSPP